MTKYQTQNFTPTFSSKSYAYSAGRPMMSQRPSQYSSGGYSSRSAVDFAPKTKMSCSARHGGGGGGGAYYQEEHIGGGYQGGGFQGGSFHGGGFQGGPIQQQQVSTITRSFGRMATDPESASVHSMRLASMPRQPYSAMMAQDDSDGSGSERDAGFARQASVHSMSNGYVASTYPRHSMYSTTRANGYEGGQQQVSSMTLPAMKGSLSRTLSSSGGGGTVEQEVYVRQQSFKGPAFRTISRINNRQQVRGAAVSSTGSMYGSSAGQFSGSQTNLAMSQGRLSRAGSVRSMHSVGRGMDVYDGMDMVDGMGHLSGLDSLDMPTAINYLDQADPELQMLGAAYIQHECYHSKDSKKAVYQMKGIPRLVQLFNCGNEEVQRYATGATRNLIYENMENKGALIESGGIPKLVEALQEPDDELRKNITGILWNLSSKDNLKEKLAREALPELTEKILIPLSGSREQDFVELSPSETDIFFNTTGCLRNLSSVSERTRQQMRETNGLVEALVEYVQKCTLDTKVEEKGVENAVCVLRNLSFQLYNEIPPTTQARLEGPTRSSGSSKGEPIGCFTPQSKKAKDRQNQDLTTFAEVSKFPKGMEWLWHPQIVELYNQVLKRCEINSTTREAAAGALQNITAGDKRWASILSRIALDQHRMLPTVIDLLKTENDAELRSLTGFLRNLSRHAKNKDDMATKVVQHLIPKLPSDGRQKNPSSDVVVNMCGALNNLVTSSSLAARDIAYFNGLSNLVGIRSNNDGSPGKLKAAKAAATVLNNMFQYKKLHKDFKSKGFQKQDFVEMPM
ncbi:plakophilin-3a isoform X2 [Triplophysa rosa]|nr:plakophilin-3a isoform X2 [Triplophysa rosa]